MKLKYTYFLFALILIWVGFTSNSSGYSGGTFTNCSNCHSGGAGTTIIDSIAVFDIANGTFVSSYVPNTDYNLILVGHHTGTLNSFGFQVTHNGKGTYSSPPAGTKLTGVSLWEHNSTNTGTGGIFTKTVTWTSPAAGSGNVTFNSYLNAVNGNSGTSGDKVSSNYSKILPQVVLTAGVSIAGPSSFCPGASVSYTATPVNGGTAPTYVWKVNGTNVGTGPTFSSSTLTSGNVITCVLTSNMPGVTGNPATSNAITVTTNTVYDNVVSISGLDTGCSGDTLTFTALPTSGSITPKYIWYKNNVKIVMANSPTLKVTGFNTGDSVYCRFTSSNACKTKDTSISNKIKLFAYPSPTVSNVINQTLCSGDSTSLTDWLGSMPNTTFTWTNNKPSIGLAASGSGNIPKFVATTTLNKKDSATITITPFANGCSGTSVVMKYYINPRPTVFTTLDRTLCEMSNQNTIVLNSNVFGSTLTWDNNNTTIGLGANGTSNIPSFITSDITADSVVSVVSYRASFAGCVGNDKTFNIKVYNRPTTNPISTYTTCSGEMTTPISITSNYTESTSSWTNINPTIGLGTNGLGDIPSFTASNTGSTPITTPIAILTTVRGCSSAPSSFNLVINPKTPPSVSITASSNPICAGMNSTFTATPFLGGSAPVFKWMINGSTVTGANSTTFTPTTLLNNDTVSCEMTSNDPCAFPTIVNSNKIIISVINSFVPTIVINSKKDTICSGDSTVFTSSTSGEGNTPIYQWYKNGSIVTGASNNTYTDYNLQNMDSVWCQLTSSLSCATIPTVISNKKQVTSLPSSLILANVTVDKTNICQGDSVTFTATIGGKPTAKMTTVWKLNGNDISYSPNQLITTAFKSITDSVEFLVNSNEKCVLPNIISIKKGMSSVSPSPSLTIIPSLYGEFCDGDSIVIKAKGTHPSFNLLWSHGVTDSSFVAKSSQSYYLTASNSISGCSKKYGPITVYKQALPVKPTVSKYSSTTLISSSSQNYQWQLNKIDLVGETFKTHLFTTQGLYRVKVSNTAGCVAYSSEIDPYSGVNAIGTLEDNSITISPVPNHGVFTINFNALNGEKLLKIYDMKGSNIYQNTTNKLSETIDISNHGKGVYFISILYLNEVKTIKITIN